MIFLKLRTDSLISPDNIAYISYGFDVYDLSLNKLLTEIPDVSLSYSAVADFIKLCNSSYTSFTHIRDLTDDFFGSP